MSTNTPNDKATIAEQMLAALKAAGVDRMFGIPGGGATAELVSASKAAGIEFVLTQHETSAIIAAGVYGQRTGTVGVAVSAIGPGVANFANGLAHAMLDRLPVLAIADRYRGGVHEVALRQQFDHLAMMRPVTKAQITLHEDTWDVGLRRAFRTALAERPGPVFIDFPNNVASRFNLPATPLRLLQPAVEARVPAAAVAEAASVVAAARRPLVLAGNTALSLPAGALARFAAALRAPVLTSAKAKGAIAADDPWSAGVFMGGKLEQALLEQCDYIVFAGFDPVELLPKPWKVPVPALWLDRVPNVEQTAAVDAELIGDLADTLSGLAATFSAGGRRVSSTWSPEDCGRFRDSVRTQLTVPVQGLSPNDVVLAARDAAPRDTVLVTDVGANKLLSVELWDAYGAHDFLMSNGLATMGFCLPAAQAVKLAEPHRPVLCLCGDAGFLMRLPELVTGRLIGGGDVKRPIVYVIFADNGHSLITVKQGKLGKSVHGLDFPSPGYADLARAFGLACAEVDNLADYRKALAEAFSRDGQSSLIAARIDSSAYAKQFDIIREL
ncbi:MAG: thiamine pyrophosphate-binding protein [bacterium]